MHAASLRFPVLDYDIRGRYGIDLLNQHARQIGALLCPASNRASIIIGRDDRESSSALRDELVSGILSCGGHAIDLGIVSSPMFYYASQNIDCGGGVMITASHMSSEFNGFKIVGSGGLPYSGDDIRQLITRDITTNGPEGDVSHYDIADQYLSHITSVSNLLSRPNIAWISHNSALSALLRLCGAKNVVCANEHARYSVCEDYGMAFELDSDGDRLTIYNKAGKYISHSVVMMIFALEAIKHGKNRILLDYQFPALLTSILQKHGGLIKLTRPGHSVIKKAIAAGNYHLAGEVSGHFYFDECGYDDGLYAANRFLQIKDALLLMQAAYRNPFNSSVFRIKVNGSIESSIRLLHYELIKLGGKYSKLFDAIKITWGLTGSIIVRRSGTENMVICCTEGKDRHGLNKINSILSMARQRCGLPHAGQQTTTPSFQI